MHELDKLDKFLGLSDGASKAALISHGDPGALNEKLAAHGITLDADGFVPDEQRQLWRSLLESIGVDRRYWKDRDLLVPSETEVADL